MFLMSPTQSIVELDETQTPKSVFLYLKTTFLQKNAF